jgi:hypothetical protein
VSSFRSRRVLVVSGALLLLALFVVRPGAGGLKTRITRSISLALARQVDIGSVHVRLLPQPAFDLETFVVHDDPSFSAEPMLRAQEVTAVIRLSSVFRGRLEISRLSLTEPSLNLVRNTDGHWNLENLLARSSAIAVAPTGRARSEHRPAFPYIEADLGRINFKIGQEKRPYALTDADFALWQDSENAWAMRLKAQPVRTDFNLSDTGLLRVDGTWQRASALRQTPLQFNLRWEHAQLGQLTKLLSGMDRGWRGGVAASLVLSGIPEDLTVTATAAVQDFHRYDIMRSDALVLRAHCVGHYRYSERRLSDVICGAPVGEGTVTVQGSVTGVIAPHDYDLTLSAEQLPMQALVKLSSHLKKDLAEDLLAQGTLNAKFDLRNPSGNGPELSGSGRTSGFQISSTSTRTELVLGSVPFSIGLERAGKKGDARTAQSRAKQAVNSNPFEVGPFNLPLGRPAPATLHGKFSRTGYSVTVQGDAQLKRLLQVARTFGIPAAQLNADGQAKLDLRLAGQWAGFPLPTITGKAQLSEVRGEIRGLNAPIAIDSASAVLEEQEVKLQHVTATLADSRWTGSLSLPRHCTSVATCPATADLHTDEIDIRKWNDLLNPHPPERPWYKLLTPATAAGPSVFTGAEASGKIAADRITIGGLNGNSASAGFELRNGKLRLFDLRADVLGGRHEGEWSADFTVHPPAYGGGGTLEQVSLDQLAEAMGDGWITGTGNAIYHVSATGYATAELLGSAEGAMQFEMREGTLPHIALLSGGGALHVRRFKGHLVLHEGQFQIEPSKLEAASGIYQVSGTASLGRTLNIKIVRDGTHAFNVTGTVDDPHVTAVQGPETQAALKP